MTIGQDFRLRGKVGAAKNAVVLLDGLGVFLTACLGAGGVTKGGWW
jgi:hypothetical protein